MAPRQFHVGLDYGTSASKIAVREYDAPGGERVDLVACDGDVRHPATVTFHRGRLYFGGAAEEAAKKRGAVRYESVKMRVAADLTGDRDLCFAPCPPLPNGVTSKDLAVLSVWWLLTAADRHIVDRIGEKRWFRSPKYTRLVTLGIPTSFFVDHRLRTAFWDVLEASRWLLREQGHSGDSIELEHALDLSTKAIGMAGPIERDDAVLREELRSEAEAALWWAIQSPAVPAGPYIKIDIGAGTTNVSYFRMEHSWKPGRGWSAQKERINFFSAASVSRGMDSIDEVLARELGDGHTAHELRGEENGHLDVAPMMSACTERIAEIYKTVRIAGRAWRQRVGSLAELMAWIGAEQRPGRPETGLSPPCRVVALGGGSLISQLIGRIARHPMRLESPLSIIDLEPPADLFFKGRRLRKSHLPFAAVAYGLANLDPVVPHWPSDGVGGFDAPVRQRLSHEDLYPE